MKTKEFSKGEIIIEEGLYETCAYIIDAGKAEVSAIVNNEKTVITTLGVNEIFGEMGLIEDTYRSATVTAIEETLLRIIDRDSFNKLFSEEPKIILPIVKMLFERLRTATKLIKINALKSMMNGNVTDDFVEKIIETRLVDEKTADDKRCIVISGTNDISKAALGNTKVFINKFPYRVGRFTENDILVSNDVLSINDLYIMENRKPYYVAKNHFEIAKIGGNFAVVDRGSRAGVIINGKTVKELCILNQKENTIIVGTSYSPFVFDISIQ